MSNGREQLGHPGGVREPLGLICMNLQLLGNGHRDGFGCLMWVGCGLSGSRDAGSVVEDLE